MDIRLNKYIAQQGGASRRGADILISEGRVKVNDKIVRELGVKINPEHDVVEVNGKKLNVLSGDIKSNNKVYFALYKPTGYVSTTTSRYSERIVTSLVPHTGRLFPVGRLDKDSEGLMILTNDGDFAYEMTHPKHEVSKTYEVRIKGEVNDLTLKCLRDGVDLEDGKTSPCEVRILRKERTGISWLQFVLHEGRKRQIRRMCATEHLFVEKLIRVKIGNLPLGNMSPGDFTVITPEDCLSGSQSKNDNVVKKDG